MGRDSKGLHSAATNSVKGHSRGMQQHAMPKPASKRPKKLEVAIMFEPTRLAHDCLQAAYTHLVPTLRRRVLDSTPFSAAEINDPAR